MVKKKLMQYVIMPDGARYKEDEFVSVVVEYFTRLKARNRPQKEKTFRDFLSEKGKTVEADLIRLYTAKPAAYTAFGLIAAFYLRLLENDPASSHATNQSALWRALRKDLGFRSTRQALRLEHRSESVWSKDKERLKFHINLIKEKIELP
jgi:hypothetical protein